VEKQRNTRTLRGMSNLKYLDDYLSQPDFKAALRPLAADFREEIGLTVDVDEIGVVCPNIEEAADYLTRTYPGMGQFFLGEGGPKSFEQEGKERKYRTRVGFGYYQDVLIELAEIGEGSDIFKTHLDPGGRITLHHLGFFARGKKLRLRTKKGLPKKGFRKPLKKRGFATEWEAVVALGGVVGHVTIFKTYEVADNLAIEFLDFRLGGVNGIKTKLPRKLMEAGAWAQIKYGPRVIYLPEPVEGSVKKRWDFTWTRQLKGTPSQVWPLVIVPDQMSRWAEATITLVEPGSDGKPDTAGMIRQAVVKVGGIKNKILETIDSTDKPNEIRYHSFKGGMVVDQKAEMTLVAQDGGTFFTWKVSFIPEIFGTGPILHGVVDKGTESSLDELVKLCDSEF